MPLSRRVPVALKKALDTPRHRMVDRGIRDEGVPPNADFVCARRFTTLPVHCLGILHLRLGLEFAINGGWHDH